MADENNQFRNELIDVSSITLLIQRAREGCDDSRERVIRRLEPFMISMAAKYNDRQLSNKHGVSDIVQQSLVKVIENFERFQGSSSGEFRGWLKSLVINEIRQIQRKWHSARRDVKRECSFDNMHLPHGFDISAQEKTPVTEAILKEQIIALKHLIPQLNECEQTIIQMRVFDGLSFVEIGHKLDRQSNSVSKAWYRLLIKLEQMMSNE